MTEPRKTILVDADGVLVDWESAFDTWMASHGYRINPGGEDEYSMTLRYPIAKDVALRLIKTFNESAAIGFLPALRDAVHYVKRLHEEHGYVFHCITSLSQDPNAVRLREMNLVNLFGHSVFEKVICLSTGADKHHALEPYRNSGLHWVEDKPENADVGYEMGLQSLLMEHGHNVDHVCPYPVVKNWREIYAIITS
jgi:FMN phosphatase YigB (HAD superfamily)